MKCDPRAGGWLLDGIFACPVLDQITPRVRLTPGDSNCIHIVVAGKVHDHPLRITGIVFAGEWFCQIGIALPVSLLVTVRDAGIAVRIGAVVPRETSMRKVVAERMPNKIARLGVANEIAAACRIAPRASARLR